MKKVLPVLLVLCINFGYAQEKIIGFTINHKFGLRSGLRENGGATFGMNFNAFSEKNVYTIGYNKIEEINFLFTTYYPHEDFHEIYTMFGHFDRKRISRFQYQIGLSVLWGVARGKQIFTNNNYKFGPYGLSLGSSKQFERKDFVTIGIPLMVAYHLHIGEIMSLGLELNTNINYISTTFNLVLCMEFGWMPHARKPSDKNQ